MRLVPRPLESLIEQFGRLPGVGPRSAERLAFFVLRSDPQSATELAAALTGLHQNIQHCTVCFNLSESELCAVCASSDRDRTVVAVVEEPLDVVALEKTAQFNGLYHVLGGVISPIDGIGPNNLQIKTLLSRIDGGEVKELILATNPSTEGETTAMYIRKELEGRDLNITRLARGLPVGGDLEYADQITLGRALSGRQRF